MSVQELALGVLMVREKTHGRIERTGVSDARKAHTSTRLRNKRARSVSFESIQTRRCGSSMADAMAPLQPPWESRKYRRVLVKWKILEGN